MSIEIFLDKSILLHLLLFSIFCLLFSNARFPPAFSLSFCNFVRRSLYYLLLRRYRSLFLLNLSGACVIEHDSCTAGRGCLRHRLGSSDGFGASIVDAHGLIVTDRGLAAAVCIRTLGLQGDEVRGALILWSIFIRHPRLHDLFQALALAS